MVRHKIKRYYSPHEPRLHRYMLKRRQAGPILCPISSILLSDVVPFHPQHPAQTQLTTIGVESPHRSAHILVEAIAPVTSTHLHGKFTRTWLCAFTDRGTTFEPPTAGAVGSILQGIVFELEKPTPQSARRALVRCASILSTPRRLKTSQTTKLAGLVLYHFSLIRPLLGPKFWVYGGGDKKPP